MRHANMAVNKGAGPGLQIPAHAAPKQEAFLERVPELMVSVVNE